MSDQKKASQAHAALYYDTADSFLLDIGAQLEQAISPSLPVHSQKILGGASPLLPVLELVIKYGPEVAAGAVGVFFTTILNKASEDFYSLLKDKFARTKNDKPVLLIITLPSDKVTVSASVQFDDYKTIADAMKAVPQVINDAHEKQSTNLDQVQQSPAISFRDEGTRTVSRSNLQFRYKYDAAAVKWTLESIHKLNE